MLFQKAALKRNFLVLFSMWENAKVKDEVSTNILTGIEFPNLRNVLGDNFCYSFILECPISVSLIIGLRFISDIN